MMNEADFNRVLATQLYEAFANEKITVLEDFSFTAFNELKRRADLIAIIPQKGIFIIQIKRYLISNLSLVTSDHWTLDDWPTSVSSPYDQAQLYVPDILHNLRRDYQISLQQVFVLIALPNVTRTQWISKKGELNPRLESAIIFSDDLMDNQRLRDKLENAPSTRSTRFNDSPDSVRGELPQKKHDIFISYRRSDSIWPAGRLADHLAYCLQDKQVFIDTKSISPGRRFKKYIEEQIIGSSVVLVVIGSSWVTCADPHSGRRRLDDENDFVRLEVSLALETSYLRDIIPILIDGASMPKREYLPTPMQGLCDFNAVELTGKNFHHEADDLAEHLADILK